MNNLQIALEKVMEKEISKYEQEEEHNFSPKFEKEMNRLLKSANAKASSKKGKRGFLILAAAVTLLTLAAGAMAKSTGFNISPYNPDTYYKLTGRAFTNSRKTFSYEDTGNSPKTLETVYTLTGLDSEYKYTYRRMEDNKSELLTIYSRSEEAIKDNMYIYKDLTLFQATKEEFSAEFSNAKYAGTEEFVYKDKTAYYSYYECFYGRNAMLVWEDGKYCFTLKGNLTKEEAVKLADSLKPYEKEIINKQRVEETP